MKKASAALYFTSIVAIKMDTALFGGHLDIEGTEPTMTRFMIYLGENQWAHFGDMQDVIYAMEKKPGATKNSCCKLALLGRKGNYREREFMKGSIAEDYKLSIKNAGYLLDLKYIENHLYACGGQRIVFKQVDKKWIRMDQGAFINVGESEYCSFEAIDGFSENDIYAVGWPGEIWHWDGNLWNQLDNPTNYPLMCVLCSKSGDVYIGGSNGLLFKGDRHKGWTNLSDQSITNEVFENITEFQGRIYITATEKIVYTDGGPIQELIVPIDGEKTYYAIDSIKEELWCVGDECILQFNGKVWKKHVCPENI